ncbi:MAG: hypothetical protein ACREE4_16525 [Stellaceae bacterium]
MPAKEVCASAIEFRDPPATGDPVHKPRTDEIGALSAEAARDPDHWRRLLDILPFAAVATYAVGQNEPLCLGPQANISAALAVAYPLPPANISRPQAPGLVEAIDVE